MSVLAYIPLHYGKEYLATTIKSIEDHVDRILIIYTGKPSYGFGTLQGCPETEDELQEIAFDTSSKILWHRVNCGDGTEQIRRENQHREIAFRFANGSDDLILAIDSDEVWDPRNLGETLEQARKTDARYIGIDGFVNFWRDFDHVVIDWFHPVRLHNLKSNRRHQKDIKGTIYHFGYCQSKEIMRYKFEVHGHKSEIFPNYLENKFYKWTHVGCGVTQLHPASRDIWPDAEPYDKSQLPEILKKHPNFDKKLI